MGAVADGRVSEESPKLSNQTWPHWSRPCPVNRPGFNVSRLKQNCAVTHSAPACPVSAFRPVGTSTASTGAEPAPRAAIHCAMRPSGTRAADAAPMPSSASMPRSNCAGGASANRTPASSARWYDRAASAGAVPGVPSHVTTTCLPQPCSCRAASRPSPPLLPGPQATHRVWACGATASASRATDRPARCIKVWGGKPAVFAFSIRRVAATL